MTGHGINSKTPVLFGWFTAVFLAAVLAAVFTQTLFILAVPFVLLALYSGWINPFRFFLVLLALIPWSVEYNFTPSLGTDLPDEPLMLLAAFIAVALLLYQPAGSSRRSLRHPLLWLLLLHIGWIGITAFFSTYPLLSVKIWAAKSWYLGAFVLLPLLLIRQKNRIKETALVWVISMLAFALLALIRHASSGFTFASINGALSPFFRNHVNYSAMLVCALPVLLAFYKYDSRQYRKWILAAIIIILAAIFFSYARGAWLALVVAAVTAWLIRRRMILTAFLTAIAIAAAAILWLKTDSRYIDFAHDYKTTVFHEDFTEHLVATYRLKDVSTAERFYRWVAGVRMSSDKPLTGFGPGTFYKNYGVYTVSAFRTWVSDNTDHSTVHNYFLLLLIEQGWPGLLFFLVLLGAMFALAQQIVHQSKDLFYQTAALVIATILSMVVTVNLLSDLIETDKVGSIFFLCLSMLVIVHRQSLASVKPGK